MGDLTPIVRSLWERLSSLEEQRIADKQAISTLQATLDQDPRNNKRIERCESDHSANNAA